jgi:hypothetical protein
MTALTSAQISALDHAGPVEAKTALGTRLAAVEAGSGLTFGLVGAMAAAGIANSNAAGVATTPSRIDHVHAANFGAAEDMAAGGVATANAAGTAVKPARADHVHAVTAAAIPIADSGTLFTTDDVESALAQAMTQANAAMSVVKATKTIGFAAFSGLTTEDTYSIDFDAALPANARVVGHEIVAVTAFDDGGADVDVKIEVGTSGGDVDSIITAFDVDTTANGAVGPGTSGVLGYPMASVSAITPAVKFTTDNAAHLVGLDSGAVTVNLFYLILA